MLREGPTYVINGSFGSPEKNLFSTANSKFCLNLHYNTDNSYLFEADNKNVNFQTQFCLGTISNGLVLPSLEKYL